MDIRGLLTDGAHVLRVAIKIIIVDDSGLPWGKPSQASKEFVHPVIGYKKYCEKNLCSAHFAQSGGKGSEKKKLHQIILAEIYRIWSNYRSDMGQIWVNYGSNIHAFSNYMIS